MAVDADPARLLAFGQVSTAQFAVLLHSVDAGRQRLPYGDRDGMAGGWYIDRRGRFCSYQPSSCRACYLLQLSLHRLLAWARTLIRVDGFPVKVFPESSLVPVFGGDPLTSLGVSGANLECI